MVKVDLERDYYGDLGLTPTADANDVKRAFKKLGMILNNDLEVLVLIL